MSILIYITVRNLTLDHALNRNLNHEYFITHY